MIFLYLADYSSSLVLLATTLVSAVIDIWKVTKVFKISLGSTSGGGYMWWKQPVLKLPWLTFGKQSEAEKRTSALDATAMDMVSLVVRFFNHLLFI